METTGDSRKLFVKNRVVEEARATAIPSSSQWYSIAMKTIQITMDEKLLARLDADDETQRDGRSAVLRRAVTEYLRRSKRASIASSYRRGYGTKTGLGPELQGWEDEGIWPND